MADVRFQVSDDFMAEMKSKLGLGSNTEVVQEALTLLSWAADEKMRERVIVSTNARGEQVERLAMRSLALPSPRRLPQQQVG